MKKWATISADGLYRYELGRQWAPEDGTRFAAFIGLNPSTADAEQDDPTIRRCIRFAQDWGFGGLVMLNLFAFRATDPSKMKLELHPVGPENDAHLSVWATASLVVAAWGAHGGFMGRDAEVVAMMQRCGVDLKCLGITKDRHPRHPLYLAANTQLIPFTSR